MVKSQGKLTVVGEDINTDFVAISNQLTKLMGGIEDKCTFASADLLVIK